MNLFDKPHQADRSWPKAVFRAVRFQQHISSAIQAEARSRGRDANGSYRSHTELGFK